MTTTATLYAAAVDAEAVWETECARIGLNRYSNLAVGPQGSKLRCLFDAKIQTSLAWWDHVKASISA